MLAEAAAEDADLGDQRRHPIGHPGVLATRRRARQIADALDLMRAHLVIALEPIDDLRRLVGASANVGEEQVALLGVMEALGEALQIVRDQRHRGEVGRPIGDGVAVGEAGRQHAERVGDAPHVAVFGFDDAKRTHGLHTPSLSAPR